MSDGELSFETRAAHAGARIEVDGAVATVGPITSSTTFTGNSIDEIHRALSPEGEGYAYGRNANPTVAKLEAVLADLERADTAIAFSSGMAAVHATLLGLGIETDEVVATAGDLYGVTRSLVAQLGQFGVRHEVVDVAHIDQVRETLRRNRVRVLCFETISNPLLRVSDVASLIGAAHEAKTLVVVDNTFATPCLFRPIELGADVVVHSATKYIAGHGDVTAGYAAANRSFGRRIRDFRTTAGGVLSPFDAWLTLRGIKTLPLRVERQCVSARTVAGWLTDQPWVARVYYPSLAAPPMRELARRQFGDRYGGVVAFDLDASEADTLRFVDALQLITPATSLGDAMSLILYPKLSSHRTLSEMELRRAGIGDSLLRLSVGLESAADLIEDLGHAAAVSGLPNRVSSSAP